MNKTDKFNDCEYIFGSLIVVANKLDKLLERDLKEFDITSKQWFLNVIIFSLFSHNPTIKEVAKEMGTSHQNVKQVALKLQEKGLLELYRDSNDARITRMRLTENNQAFWAKSHSKGLEFTNSVFKEISQENLKAARKVITQMLINLDEMEEKK